MALQIQKQVWKTCKPIFSVLQKKPCTAEAVAENRNFFTFLSRKSSTLKEDRSNKVHLEDKVAVVTGGASGIGYAVANELLKEDVSGTSSVTVIDNNKEKLQESVRHLGEEHGEDRILPIEADVSNIEQMDAAFRNTVLHYHTIDIIINNAGILDDGKWEQELKINTHGCVIGTLLGMQYMARSSSGSGGIIVNVGSLAGLTPWCGFPIYTMTQFGVVGFTKALGSGRLYERTGVKVFGYCPCLTKTAMLENLAEKSINDNFAAEFVEDTGNMKVQRPEIVAKGLVGTLHEAKPGSIWVAMEDKEPFEVSMSEMLKKAGQSVDQATR
ncbi:unnamed protein product [Acanthoscelides obtectus]|uniref:15-hydroxyprostaglandin dehydrogenase [NAD(+)]-like n=2 Tax=Acanthoscelides obtectus TaxID=200917 RepID=A0A9P0MFA2_ACAOB|nr:unnamed protein product [Acanthoscelides obtectus]CAK1659269.1 15-hydroxyprostaglandin dehydrogenase [NAD(+)] [Acanthoscelides obtectus]